MPQDPHKFEFHYPDGQVIVVYGPAEREVHARELATQSRAQSTYKSPAAITYPEKRDDAIIHGVTKGIKGLIPGLPMTRAEEYKQERNVPPFRDQPIFTPVKQGYEALRQSVPDWLANKLPAVKQNVSPESEAGLHAVESLTAAGTQAIVAQAIPEAGAALHESLGKSNLPNNLAARAETNLARSGIKGLDAQQGAKGSTAQQFVKAFMRYGVSTALGEVFGPGGLSSHGIALALDGLAYLEQTPTVLQAKAALQQAAADWLVKGQANPSSGFAAATTFQKPTEPIATPSDPAWATADEAARMRAVAMGDIPNENYRATSAPDQQRIPKAIPPAYEENPLKRVEINQLLGNETEANTPDWRGNVQGPPEPPASVKGTPETTKATRMAKAQATRLAKKVQAKLEEETKVAKKAGKPIPKPEPAINPVGRDEPRRPIKGVF